MPSSGLPAGLRRNPPSTHPRPHPTLPPAAPPLSNVQRVTYVFEDGSDLQEAAEQPGAGVAEGAPVGGDNGEVELGSLSDTDIEVCVHYPSCSQPV